MALCVYKIKCVANFNKTMNDNDDIGWNESESQIQEFFVEVNRAILNSRSIGWAGNEYLAIRYYGRYTGTAQDAQDGRLRNPQWMDIKWMVFSLG